MGLSPSVRRRPPFCLCARRPRRCLPRRPPGDRALWEARSPILIFGPRGIGPLVTCQAPAIPRGMSPPRAWTNVRGKRKQGETPHVGVAVKLPPQHEGAISPCRREVRPLRATSGQHETEFSPSLVLGLRSWVFGLWSWTLAPVPAARGNQFWPPTTGHCRGAEGDSPIFVASCHKNRDSPRPLLPPFPSVPELCVSRQRALPDNSGIATPCPARGYNAGRQFCGAPYNGLFAAHNVSLDETRTCDDVFTTAKYARPGVGRENRGQGVPGRKGQSHFCGVLPQKLGQSLENASGHIRSDSRDASATPTPAGLPPTLRFAAGARRRPRRRPPCRRRCRPSRRPPACRPAGPAR